MGRNATHGQRRSRARRRRRASLLKAGATVAAWACFLVVLGCGVAPEAEELTVPRGYLASLNVNSGGRQLQFGPFVGYYFRPVDPKRLEELRFVCFNEGRFYASDAGVNAKLFEGTAVFAELPEAGVEIPQGGRITPMFFQYAPEDWLATRPDPTNVYVHFHSCYDGMGAVPAGYWFRHVAVTNFTYDMGGRVGPKSPLYHRVRPGVDTSFARIIEFDRGRR